MSVLTEGPTSVSLTVGSQEIVFETGKLAKQADGAVVVSSGETMVLATAQGRMEGREGADFFPLTVDVEERMYAAGKIPGGFFKREGRPTERAILTARMIDRPIRPLWPKGFRNEELTSELEAAHGQAIRERIHVAGLKEAGAIVEELQAQLSPELTMESMEEDIVRQLQVRSSLTSVLDRQRLAAVEAPLREQFE